MKIILSAVMILVFQVSCQHKGGRNSSPAETSTSSSACVDSVCQIKVEGYPHDVAVLIPPYADFKQASVFFHGFSFGKERDRDLKSILNDFEIAKSFKESL